MDPFNKVASLNVGGVRYDVAISTLMKYPNSMLAALVSDRWHGTDGNALHDVDDSDKEPLFIDRDGQRFQHILDFLRDGKCWLPFTTPLEALLSDANFFSIPLNASVVEFQHGLQLTTRWRRTCVPSGTRLSQQQAHYVWRSYPLPS
eukprot:GEMP01052512.1.p1 GENE.GEMP01052512.1~~GEMP01052512.1.p1  ORF type:complete len:147 (+),score=35.25 GEMP01052512.1:130-570(+)